MRFCQVYMIPDNLLNFFNLFFFWIFFSIFLNLVDFFPRSICSLYVLAFKTKYMSLLDWNRMVETRVSVVYKLEKYLEHGRNIPRARSKNTNCPAVIRSHKEFPKTKIFLNIFDSNCKPVFQKIEKNMLKNSSSLQNNSIANNSNHYIT